MQAEARRPRVRWQVWFLLAVIGALVFAELMGSVTDGSAAAAAFRGDPTLYEGAMDRLFDGEVPYLDFAYEHLPFSIVPMALAYLVTSATSIGYVGAFALLSALLLYGTSELVIRLGRRLGVVGIEHRWLLLLAPLLPIALYRVDSLPVLLAVAAVLLAVSRKETGSLIAQAAGILAKGWPVVLSGQDWWRGKRLRAISVVTGTAVLMGLLLMTEGFRSGRAFTGIHQETIIGSLIALQRALTGADLGFHGAAGAHYVETGMWAIGLNLLVGIALAVIAWTATRSPFSWPGAVLLTGALTMALLLGSPLLSPQFLLWAMPFVALGRGRMEWWALAGAAAVATLLVGYWSPGDPWWHAVLVGRNALLVVAAVGTVITLLERRSSEASVGIPVSS